MTLRKRAARVWASQGQAAAVLNDMTDEEAEGLANLEGSPNFRQEFNQFHADYYEARKAAEPPSSEVENA